MKISLKAIVLLAGTALSGSAAAHVGYGGALFLQAGTVDAIGSQLTAGNVIATDTSNVGGSFISSVSSNAGYLTGFDPTTWGNTHDIRFRYFELSTTSEVKFTITGLNNTNGADVLNPAYSLFSNIVPPTSHDGVGDVAAYAAATSIKNFNAGEAGFASWSPFAAVDPVIAQAKIDTGSTVPQSNDKWGSFRSNADVTVGNNGTNPGGAAFSYEYAGVGNATQTPTVGTIHYLGLSGADASTSATFNEISGASSVPVLGADGSVDHKVSFDAILGPGIYTLAVGGANVTDYNQYVSDTLGGGAIAGNLLNTAYNNDRLARNFSISFSAAAVPEPEQWAMLSLGLTLLGLYAKRKQPA